MQVREICAGRLLEVAQNDQDFTGTHEPEFPPRHELERGRILLQSMHVASECRILAFQLGDFHLSAEEILARLDGLEKAALPQDRVEEQNAAKKHDRESEVPRAATLPRQRIRRGAIGNGSRITGHVARRYQMVTESTRQKGKRPRPERGAQPPSERERGWGPASSEKRKQCAGDQARRSRRANCSSQQKCYAGHVTSREFKRWLADHGCTFEPGHGGHLLVRCGELKSGSADAREQTRTTKRDG